MVRFMQSHGLGHLRSFGHEPLLHRSYDERRLRSPRYHRAGVYPRGYHYDDQLYSGGSLCHDCSNGIAYAGCNDPHCSQYEDDWYYNRFNTGQDTWLYRGGLDDYTGRRGGRSPSLLDGNWNSRMLGGRRRGFY